MSPLSEFSAEARRAVRGVLCDLDDTLTIDGRLTADAYAGLRGDLVGVLATSYVNG